MSETIHAESTFGALRSAAKAARDAGRLPEFLGELEKVRTEVLLDAGRPTMPSSHVQEPDVAVRLPEAAAMFGEPVETFRRRLQYKKALVKRPGERRLRYSRAELERILRDRLAGNSCA